MVVVMVPAKHFSTVMKWLGDRGGDWLELELEDSAMTAFNSRLVFVRKSFPGASGERLCSLQGERLSSPQKLVLDVC